jgi:hypothetical protein
MYGWWGQALAEQIQNIQLEINKLLWIIQRSMHLAGTFKILLENGSKIVKEHLSNDIGAVICYTGKAPEYVVPGIVPIELYSHLQNLKESAYEQSGISQMSAFSQKQPGLDAAVAIREMSNIESDRFMTVGHAYEDFYMELAKLSVAEGRSIYEEKKDYKVISVQKNFIETIDWKDINLRDDQFVMKVFPVSSLPQDPAGRLQTVQEYIQAGMYTIREGRRLLDFPDTEQIETLQNSQEDYFHKIFEEIIDEGTYTAPDEFDNLDLGRELALEYMSQGKRNGLEEEKLELIRRFISQIDLLMAKMAPVPQEPPLQAIPPANPEPTPQSNLVPNLRAA